MEEMVAEEVMGAVVVDETVLDTPRAQHPYLDISANPESIAMCATRLAVQQPGRC
jgi:hypothetical protein